MQAEKRKALLVGDLGGTSFRLLLVDDDGNVLKESVLPSQKGADPQQVVFRMSRWTLDGLGENNMAIDDLAGVALAVAGPVDTKNGIVHQTPNVWSELDVPLGQIISEILGVKLVIILNDADAAALGEHAEGAGQGAARLLFLTWSTGIGGGIVANDELVDGCEAGHVVVPRRGRQLRCGCGKHNHLEAIAGGRAIANRAKRLSVRNKELRIALLRLGAVNAENVFRAAREGNLAARQFVYEAAEAMGYALVNLIVSLRPERIVIGGGLMKSKDLLLERVLQVIADNLMPGVAATWSPETIVEAKLGERMGVAGCLAILKQRLRQAA